MHYNRKFKPELIVSKNEMRPILANPWLVGNTVQATDGKMLISLPVHREKEDKDGPIGLDSLKMANAVADTIDGVYLDLSSTDTVKIPFAEGATLPRPGAAQVAQQWPNTAQVIPAKDRKPEVEITFDAEALYRLACAMAAPQASRYSGNRKSRVVTLRIAVEVINGMLVAKFNPMRVEAEGFDGDAVLMPCRRSESI